MDSIPLTAPEEFRAFPYIPPYSIQTDLMRHVYLAVENRKLAIIESPTGTVSKILLSSRAASWLIKAALKQGKTLSLLTSTLTWLRNDKDRTKKTTMESLWDSLHSLDDPEWVATQTFDRMKNQIEAEELAFEEHLAALRSREESLLRECARVTKKPRLTITKGNDAKSDDDWLLPDCEGINGKDDAMPFPHDTGIACYSKSAIPSSDTKIFFASRTHSQLSQVVHELLKLRPFSPVPGNAKGSQELPCNISGSSRQLPRSVSLASRKHLCINEQLRAKTADLDEGCRELLTGRREERCPYLPSLGEENRLNEFRDQILACPKDIEDLVLLGKNMRLCPYFGSRSAISSAELVTLPYNLLLHKRSRQALEIDLQDQVVVIDEAHNLIDTLLQLQTIELSTFMLRLAIRQLAEYLDRFRTRLNNVHAIHLKRLALFLQALNQFAVSRSTARGRSPDHDEVMSVSGFVENMGNKVNGINFLELESYLTASKVARKISRYSEQRQDNDAVCSDRTGSGAVLPLHVIEAFIANLSNSVEDGIITLTEDKLMPNETVIKYQHLNPATCFEEVTRSARCVILAGGTMSPISDISLQLFPTVPEEQLLIFSCGHVIPQANLQCLVLGSGPRGKDLEFKFKSRDDQSLVDELGQCLFNVASVCPNGTVVFFPSYSFLDKVKRDWLMSGLLDRIQRKKQLFYEPNESAKVDDILRKYTLACSQVTGTTKGALLFAVVGAKLSEGLNFADELARAVVLVGIPYPNLASPELRERMKYISNRKRSTAEKATATDPGNELYENLAMRAVNQSIGRAIRHQNDWSALILIDKRYESQKVRLKLPTWIRQNMVVSQSFGQAVKLLGDFYRAKRLL